MGGVVNFQNFIKLEGVKKLKWVEKIKKMGIDPSTISDLRVHEDETC